MLISELQVNRKPGRLLILDESAVVLEPTARKAKHHETQRTLRPKQNRARKSRIETPGRHGRTEATEAAPLSRLKSRMRRARLGASP